MEHKSSITQYDVQWDGTVKELKSKVSAKESLHVDSLQLMLDGKKLDDDVQLFQSRVFDKKIIPVLQLVER